MTERTRGWGKLPSAYITATTSLRERPRRTPGAAAVDAVAAAYQRHGDGNAYVATTRPLEFRPCHQPRSPKIGSTRVNLFESNGGEAAEVCRLLPLPRLLAAYLAGCSQCCGSIEAPKEIIPDPTGPANFIIEKAGFFTSTFKVKREVRELPRFMVA